MNCFNCNEIIITDVNNKHVDSSKFGDKLKDGNIYCNGCIDAMDLLCDNIKIKEIIIPPKIDKKINNSILICVYCKKNTTDIKCTNCGKISPLCKRK
jgi:hypothetical protein